MKFEETSFLFVSIGAAAGGDPGRRVSLCDQDVWHETVEDREKQCEILLKFCETRKDWSALVLMGQPWDAVLFEGGDPKALAEVKCRRHEFGRYADYTIDCAKMDAIWGEAERRGLWTCLIVDWEGDTRWGRVGRSPYPVTLQKRRDRDELADRVYHIPLTLFERVKDLAVA